MAKLCIGSGSVGSLEGVEVADDEGALDLLAPVGIPLGRRAAPCLLVAELVVRIGAPLDPQRASGSSRSLRAPARREIINDVAFWLLVQTMQQLRRSALGLGGHIASSTTSGLIAHASSTIASEHECP